MKLILECVILGFLCLLSFGKLIADERDGALNEAQLKLEMQRAEAGDAEAMYSLGYHYSVEEYADETKAFEWFLKSARGGCVEGEYVVGYSYLDGRVVEKNIEEGGKWLKLAAKHGSPDAQGMLAYFYYDDHAEGLGIDSKEAWGLLKSAARLGDPSCNYFLGLAYYEDCDWETADAVYKKRVVRLMTRAADKDYPPAQYFLALLYYTQGDKDFPQNTKKSFEWMAKFAENEECMKFYLGGYYALGIGCDVDVKKGIDHFMSQEKPYYQQTLYMLACCFLKEGTVTPDDQETLSKMETQITWLKELQDEGNTLAKSLLDAGYQAGKTGKDDIQKMIAHLQEKADQGDMDANYLLAMFCDYGIGCERNAERVVELLQLGVKKEHADSELFLATHLWHGDGVKRDIKMSKEMVRLAAEHGSKDAKKVYQNRKEHEKHLEKCRPSQLE